MTIDNIGKDLKKKKVIHRLVKVHVSRRKAYEEVTITDSTSVNLPGTRQERSIDRLV